MTTFDTTKARAVLDWIDVHPDLPKLCEVEHNTDRHTLHIGWRPTIREFLAWHDEVTNARVEMRYYPDDKRVHFFVHGALPSVPSVGLYGSFRGAECDLLLANGLVRDDAKSLVDVEVLRRLSDARGPEAGA